MDELHKRGERQNEQQYRNAPNKFRTCQMELLSKLLEQIAFKTRPQIKQFMLVVMDESTRRKIISTPTDQ